jgi:hypothetical protein
VVAAGGSRKVVLGVNGLQRCGVVRVVVPFSVVVVCVAVVLCQRRRCGERGRGDGENDSSSEHGRTNATPVAHGVNLSLDEPSGY